MNIDELKTAWQEYDVKLQSTQLLTERIVTTMIRDRSDSRLSELRRTHFYGLIYMILMFIAGIAVLAGNPFDYKQIIEYIPMSIYTICIAILTAGMIRAYMVFSRVEINHDNLERSLKTIISVYENPNKFFAHAVKMLIFSSTILFPLSFLPRKIEAVGLWPGIIDTLIPIFISVSMVFIAYKLGAFKERQAEKFKMDMEELNNLKGISEELKQI
ncbi:MAG: hypothetical protein WKF68_13575 [Daejeonella sp.]